MIYNQAKHLLLLLLLMLTLTACSAAQEVSNGVDYARGATNYINQVLTFKADVTQFMAQGKFNHESRKAFLPKVEQMKKDVAAFEALTPANIAPVKDIHQQITDFNLIFKPSLDTMTTVLNAETPEFNIEQLNGKIAEGLESAKKLQTVLDPLKNYIK